MTRCIVVGASGRMGRRLVANILADETMSLAGAVEYSGSPEIGRDAGSVAGCGECGVKIVSDFAPLLAQADVVINFATAGVVECARAAVAAGVAIVIGTTALGNEEKQALAELGRQGGRLVFASNMSVGVNVLFKLAREAAHILGTGYDIEIVEMHHNQKEDAPSGTAMTLAEILCEERKLDVGKDLRHGRVGMVGKRTPTEIGVHSLRGGDVVGDHTVIFAIDGERIELTHRASSRDTFVHGALRAAQFLKNAAPGVYSMQDVLGLK